MYFKLNSKFIEKNSKAEVFSITLYNSKILGLLDRRPVHKNVLN